MKRLTVGTLAMLSSVVAFGHPVKPHVVRCDPVDGSNSKVELSFYYQSNEKKKKKCRIGVGNSEMKEKKWKDIDCKLKDGRKEFQFEVGDSEKPLILTIVKDRANPENSAGEVKGFLGKTEIEHGLDCEVIFEE